jgi:thiol-disulfide isomerase/thioredoxin
MFLFFCATVFAAPEMIPVEVFESAKATEIRDKATDVEIALRDGGYFRLSEHRGKPVVLAFWASWCGPCRLELPALSTWSREHPEVMVYAVSVDRSRQAAEQFLKRVQFDLPVAFDPDATHLGRYGVLSMPTMFLFDKSGNLAWRHTGYSKEKGFGELDTTLAGLP